MQSGRMTSLVSQHDCLLLDLDGTVFRGHVPTDGAVPTLAAASARTLFVTNNASRSAEEVAEHLRVLGFTATAADVVTSAQSAARLLAERLPAAAAVLVVGTEALAAEVTAVGLAPVQLFSEDPAAVVQGLSMTTCWADLAEASLAIRAGALWVSANLDPTFPAERGLLPGNGSMVAALRAATGAEPLVAGKPGPALMEDALARGSFAAPLVVGDRLDTDIAGANAVGLPSLMVLTGVSTAREAVFARPAERPTYIGADLRALQTDVAALAVAAHPAWRVERSGDGLVVGFTGADPGRDGLSVVRATAWAAWQLADGQPAALTAAHGQPAALTAADDTAHDALQRWSLLESGIG